MGDNDVDIVMKIRKGVSEQVPTAQGNEAEELLSWTRKARYGLVERGRVVTKKRSENNSEWLEPVTARSKIILEK